MAPNRDIMEARKELMEKYGIKFEGPLSPKRWPAKHKHIFSVITNISATRYDEYKKDAHLDGRALRLTMNRVKQLRNNALRLRKNIKTSEYTWRTALEPTLMERFSKSAICDRCKFENWASDYHAEPSDEADAMKLRRKRARRKQCECHRNIDSMDQESNDSDEDDSGEIFQSLADCEISQAPDVIRENVSVSMKPDRTVGLYLTDQLMRYLLHHPLNLTHRPAVGGAILYPFMLIEAKSGDMPPGFRSIEAQTAFPIRRLLMVQDDLRKSSSYDFEPLIWFFGYQGEIWRLYAGILDGSSVRVFDLWLGTIESQDGALQLIQIFDFIWTWARDVYRPSIHRCLQGDGHTRERFSPTSSDTLTRSQSVFSARALPNLISRAQSHRPDSAHDDLYLAIDNSNATIESGLSHPLFQWLESRDIPAGSASQVGLRHYNVVSCSFRVLELPDTRESFEDLTQSFEDSARRRHSLSALLALMQQSRYLLQVTRAQIFAIQSYWTGTEMDPSTASDKNFQEEMQAFFFFRTFIGREDWQITREIYCIIWSLRTAKTLSELTNTRMAIDNRAPLASPRLHEVLRETQRVRDLLGSASLDYALKEVTLMLARQPLRSQESGTVQWTLPPSQGVTAAVIAQYCNMFEEASSDMSPHRGSLETSTRLLWIRQRLFREAEPSPFLFLPPIEVPEGAMFVVNPDYRSLQCPKFCLFLLEDRRPNEASLEQVIRSALRSQIYNMNSTSGPLSLTSSDKHAFQSWIAALGLR